MAVRVLQVRWRRPGRWDLTVKYTIELDASKSPGYAAAETGSYLDFGTGNNVDTATLGLKWYIKQCAQRSRKASEDRTGARDTTIWIIRVLLIFILLAATAYLGSPISKMHRVSQGQLQLLDRFLAAPSLACG